MALSQLLKLFGCMKIQTLHAPYHFNSGLGSVSYWERGFAHVSDGTLFLCHFLCGNRNRSSSHSQSSLPSTVLRQVAPITVLQEGRLLWIAVGPLAVGCVALTVAKFAGFSPSAYHCHLTLLRRQNKQQFLQKERRNIPGVSQEAGPFRPRPVSDCYDPFLFNLRVLSG